METRKRWQLYLIVVVVLLTIYNILPTIFYYSKPLHEPIGEREGNRVAVSIAKRVNSLEGDAIDWLRSFFRLLKIKPSSLTFNLESPEVITLQFKSNEEAETLRRYQPRSAQFLFSIFSKVGPSRRGDSSLQSNCSRPRHRNCSGCGRNERKCGIYAGRSRQSERSRSARDH